MDEVGKGETSEILKQKSRLVGKPECWAKEEGKGHRRLKKKSEGSLPVVKMGQWAFRRSQVHACLGSDH